MTNDTFWGPEALPWEKHLALQPVGKASISSHEISPSLLPLFNQCVFEAIQDEEQTSLGYALNYKVTVIRRTDNTIGGKDYTK